MMNQSAGRDNLFYIYLIIVIMIIIDITIGMYFFWLGLSPALSNIVRIFLISK